jgi:hypothetical protein
MITFSSALILFAVAFTILFTGLLTAMHNRGDREVSIADEDVWVFMLKASLTLSIILLALVLVTDIKQAYSQYYYALVALDASLLVAPMVAMRSGERLVALALPTIIILQVDLLNSQFPPTDIAIGEGAEMYRGMYVTGRWSFSFSHNPAYNPFPAQVYQVVALGKVMGLGWFSALLWGFWYTIFVVAFDLLIYVVTFHLVHDVRAALIATLLMNTTPETSVTMNPHLWLSTFLVILAMITAIKSIESRHPMGYAVVSVVSYATAMLSLTTAILIIIVSIFLLLAVYVLPRLRLYQLPVDWNRNMGVLTMLLASYTVITTLDMVYTSGYLQYVYPMIQAFVNGLVMKLLSLFIRHPSSVRGPEHFMLYASANPVLAYAWSLAISIATAYLLYVITVKRRESPWIIGFLLTGIMVPVLTALQMLFFRGGEPINTNAYTAIPLVFPVVGLVMSKLRNKGLSMLALLTVLLIALVFVGAHDPDVNPVEYAKIHKFNMPQLPKSVYKAAISVASFLSNDISGLYVYSPIMGTVPWYNPAVGWVGGYPSNVGVSGLDTALSILNKTYTGSIYVVTDITKDDIYYFTYNFTTFPPGIAYIPLDKYDVLYSSNYFTIYTNVK